MAQGRKYLAPHPAEMTVSESAKLEQGEGSHIVRSLGSIKRSVKKIPPEGLIVLPPEPGLVKFESGGISIPGSSMDSVSVVRSGSAGRVEKSLKLARKMELEGEVSRKNSTGTEITCNDNSIISNLEELKLTKQDEGMETPPKTAKVCHDNEDSDSSDSQLSSDSDKDDMEDGENCGANDPSKNVSEAPVELKGEFLKAVMDEEYGKAKELCHKILLLEPDNKICSEFHAVIVEKMQQDAADEDENSSDEDDDSSAESNESGEEDESEDSDYGKKDDSDNDESSSDDDDDDFTLPSGPINLIMGGLPIRPQSRQ